VEAGRLRTGRVRIGSGVTIGLGTVIDIDVEIVDGCQIGASSLIPKHTRITAPGIYAGTPVRPLNGVSGGQTQSLVSLHKRPHR
jgi:carbonic anhydrase/acetyltransferase-like protein (isoleucine patch superfamily)